MRGSLSRVTTLLAALTLLAPAGRAGAAELKVLSTIALGEAWHELQPKFEATGHTLTLVTTTFSAAVLATTGDPAAAKALVDFLRSPETVATLKAKGFEM